MMTTKEQEREALDKIRKIVEGLGENSYVGMAFDGCFEIAEDNIGNDFGRSMKQRAESAEKRNESLRAENERLKAENADLGKALEKSEKKRLAQRDLQLASGLVRDKKAALTSRIKNAAQRIVETADKPEDAQFRNAVNDHRAGSAELESYERLSQAIAEAILA